MSSRREEKQQARAQRVALEEQLRAAAARRRRRRRTGAVLAVLTVLGVGGITVGSGGNRSASAASPIGPEGAPVPRGPQLAAPAAAAGGRTVDRISCLGTEQLLFHIHVHLTVFVDGIPRQIPGGIGIVAPQSMNTPEGQFVGGGSCFYWLHTHAADGIIHIESPVHRIYTLGDFFDVWGQPLSSSQIGPARGRVVTLDNGRPYLGNPREVRLTAHAQIQLEIGSPRIAPEMITFPPGL